MTTSDKRTLAIFQGGPLDGQTLTIPEPMHTYYALGYAGGARFKSKGTYRRAVNPRPAAHYAIPAYVYAWIGWGAK